MEKVMWAFFGSLIIIIITTIGTGIKNKHKLELHPLVLGMAFICVPITPILIVGYFIPIINGVYIVVFYIIIITLVIKYIKYFEFANYNFLAIPLIYFILIHDLSFDTPDDLFYGNIVEAGTEFWEEFGYSKSHEGVYQKNIYTYVTIPLLYFRSFISYSLQLNPQLVNGAINGILRFSLISIGIKGVTRHWPYVTIVFLGYNNWQWSTLFVRDLDVMFALSLIFLSTKSEISKNILSMLIAVMSSTSIVVLFTLMTIDSIKNNKLNPKMMLYSLLWVPQSIILLPIILLSITANWIINHHNIWQKLRIKQLKVISFISLVLIYINPVYYYSFVDYPWIVIMVSSLVLFKYGDTKEMTFLLACIAIARIIPFLNSPSEFRILSNRLSAIAIFIMLWSSVHKISVNRNKHTS